VLRYVIWQKFTAVSEVLANSIITAMTEGSYLHTRRNANLKSDLNVCFVNELLIVYLKWIQHNGGMCFLTCLKKYSDRRH
jgi:hypothetical protein